MFKKNWFSLSTIIFKYYVFCLQYINYTVFNNGCHKFLNILNESKVIVITNVNKNNLNVGHPCNRGAGLVDFPEA